jgi:pyruvate formate-lyase/glycerol dehydratase family glycyl radical enzyme
MEIAEIEEAVEKIDRISFLKKHLPSGTRETCIDRAVLITEGYKNAATDNIIIRRAKALANVLNKMTVRIFQKELIVGDQSVSQQAGHNYPEFGMWGSGDQLAEVRAFWQENPRLRAAGSLFGHTVPGFQKLIEKGFRGIKEEAQKKLDELDPTNPDELVKDPFWRAMVILAEAAGNFGKRYAQKASKMTSIENDPDRKHELERIAEVCQQVPYGPARNFYEALQSIWFGLMMIELEDPPNAHSIGRIDQMLYPFYKKDIESGNITREKALELLQCFALKIWKSYDVQDTMIGGQNPDGTDAVNEISFLYLEAVEKVDLHLQLSARYHRNTDKRFWHRVAEVNARRRGLPQMFNDEVIIPALVKKGIPLEEARDYAIIGCIEVTVPGRCDPRVVNHYTNLAKCLEYALNDGVCMISGKQAGPKTGNPAGFTSYEDVWEAYKAQVEYDIRRAVPGMHRAEFEQRERFPMPILSLLTDDCIQNGMDITAGGARYNSTGVSAYAQANAGDSLAAIKKLVFDEKRLSLTEIAEAMRSNFEGKEALRQMLINEAPKYGNDDDYADSIVVNICRHYCEELTKYRNPRGGGYHAHFLSFVLAVSGGSGTGASADGRKAGQPVANSLAPQQGRDRKGATAMLKSISKIDQTLAAAGTSLIFDIHPSALSGEKGVDNLENLLTTYFNLGGGHAECNIVDEKILRLAQKEPDKYRSLSVRVAGYSAYFVDLDSAMQEHIIQKTKNVL